MEINFQKGNILVKSGDLSKDVFILFVGTVGMNWMSKGLEIPIGQHQDLSFFGEIHVLTDETVPVTIQTLKDSHIYKISRADFLDVVHQCRDFERTIFKTVQNRVLDLGLFIQNCEKIAPLGTLAARLAHENNNSVAVVGETLKDVTPAMLELQ